MAINRVDYPTGASVPIAGDWALINDLVVKSFQNVNVPIQFIPATNVVPQGATFQVGGVIYYADSNTAITGTPSNYVKLTPTGGGATLVPTYVANLSGVTWDTIYNGYYDGSGNLYIFDEVKAILATDLAAGVSRFAELWQDHIVQQVKPTSDVAFNSIDTNGGTGIKTALVNVGNWDMNATPTVNINHGLTLSKILSVSVYIRNDADTSRINFPAINGTTASPTIDAWCSGFGATQVTLSRRDGSVYAINTAWNDPAYNRGELEIRYTL